MQVNTFSEDLNAKGAKVAIVRSRFNEAVTQRMLDAAIDTLNQAQVEDTLIVEVPGAFEIPLVVNELAKSNEYDAIITLGCVIRGETPHDQYISNSAIMKIQDLMVEYSIPIVLGIITPLSQEQADARSTGESNKGIEASKAALEMLQIMNNL